MDKSLQTRGGCLWEHVTCVFSCAHSRPSIAKRVAKTCTTRHVTWAGFVQMFIHYLWKDCLNVFQVWYFLQGSWNDQLAKQPYYCRWWVILLLKRNTNFNCLILTCFILFPDSFTPFRNLKVQPSNGKCTKKILASHRYSCHQLFGCDANPSSLMTFGCLRSMGLEVFPIRDLGGEHQTAWRCYLAPRCADHTLGFFTWLSGLVLRSEKVFWDPKFTFSHTLARATLQAYRWEVASSSFILVHKGNKNGKLTWQWKQNLSKMYYS